MTVPLLPDASPPLAPPSKGPDSRQKPLKDDDTGADPDGFAAVFGGLARPPEKTAKVKDNGAEGVEIAGKAAVTDGPLKETAAPQASAKDLSIPEEVRVAGIQLPSGDGPVPPAPDGTPAESPLPTVDTDPEGILPEEAADSPKSRTAPGTAGAGQTLAIRPGAQAAQSSWQAIFDAAALTDAPDPVARPVEAAEKTAPAVLPATAPPKTEVASRDELPAPAQPSAPARVPLPAQVWMTGQDDAQDDAPSRGKAALTLDAVRDEPGPPGAPQFAIQVQSSPAPRATGIATPDLPRHVAHQLASGMTGTNDGRADILLQPEELGRVRMQIDHRAAGLNMVITADRPETADLMRRHLETLAQEFRAIGYRDVTFSFGGQRGDQRQAPAAESQAPQHRSRDTAADTVPEIATARPSRAALSVGPGAGLDLRL